MQFPSKLFFNNSGKERFLFVLVCLATLLQLIATKVSSQPSTPIGPKEGQVESRDKERSIRAKALTEILMKDGSKLTFQELSDVGTLNPKQEKEILSSLSEELEDEYRQWRYETKQQVLKDLKESNAALRQDLLIKKESNAALRQDLLIKRRMLIEGYEKYVSLAERKQLVPKQSQLDDIVEHKSTPAELRERARALRRGLE